VNVTAVLITREAQYPADAWPDFPFQDVSVVTQCPDVLTRYKVAAHALSPVVYFQDDDCRVNVEALWDHYDGRLTHAITLGHKRIYDGTGVTLIGWGSFFPTEKARVFVDSLPYWNEIFGADVVAMEADRIFTFVNQPHNSVIMPIMQFARRVKMCERSGHYQLKDRMIKRLKELANG
jgi:hypothetical protein